MGSFEAFPSKLDGHESRRSSPSDAAGFAAKCCRTVGQVRQVLQRQHLTEDTAAKLKKGKYHLEGFGEPIAKLALIGDQPPLGLVPAQLMRGYQPMNQVRIRFQVCATGGANKIMNSAYRM